MWVMLLAQSLLFGGSTRHPIFFFEQCHYCLTLIKQLYFINRTYICTSYVLGCNILLNIIVFSVVDLFTAIYHLLVGSPTPVLAVVESGLL
jgi:hypothetical protein